MGEVNTSTLPITKTETTMLTSPSSWCGVKHWIWEENGIITNTSNENQSSDSLVDSLLGLGPGAPGLGWSDSLVNSLLGFGPGVPVRFPIQAKNFPLVDIKQKRHAHPLTTHSMGKWVQAESLL